MTIESPATSADVTTGRIRDGQAVGSIDPADMRILIDSAAGVSSPAAKTGDYTCALIDRGTCLEMNSASNFSFFINTDANVNFDVGTVVEFCRMGTGTVTIAATTPATTTLRSPTGTFTIRAQYSHVSVRKRAANEWVLSGDLS